MTQRIERRDAATSLTVVADGPISRGPEFNAGARGHWRDFDDAERTALRAEASEKVRPGDSYDQLYRVARHMILGADGQPVTPIIQSLAIANEGYIVTWHQTFWQEGFCVHDGRPAFLSIGVDEGYCSHGGILRYVEGGAGVEVDRAGLETHLSREVIALRAEEIRAGAMCRVPTLIAP